MNHDEYIYEAGKVDFICFPATHEPTEKYVATYGLEHMH
jgi:hypothetical protein